MYVVAAVAGDVHTHTHTDTHTNTHTYTHTNMVTLMPQAPSITKSLSYKRNHLYLYLFADSVERTVDPPHEGLGRDSFLNHSKEVCPCLETETDRHRGCDGGRGRGCSRIQSENYFGVGLQSS